MTPRQRITRTLRGERVDRIPLDIGGTESSGLTGIAYNRLRAHLGLPPGRTQIFDTLQQVVKIEDDLRERLGIDYPYVLGSAADDDVLVRAGIERAAGLATALPEDKDNIFVVISARGLNPDLRIISKLVGG